MPKTTTINKVIEEFSHLEMEDKEYVAELINKQLIDAKREKIARRSKAAMENLKNGKVSEGTVEDLYRDLEND